MFPFDQEILRRCKENLGKTTRKNNTLAEVEEKSMKALDSLYAKDEEKKKMKRKRVPVELNQCYTSGHVLLGLEQQKIEEEHLKENQRKQEAAIAKRLEKQKEKDEKQRVIQEKKIVAMRRKEERRLELEKRICKACEKRKTVKSKKMVFM